MKTQTLDDALRGYFEESGFDETTYVETWTRFKVGPVPVIIPNTPQRKRLIKRHDLHHIATGYGTDIVGEGEQAAWEIGSGCGADATAWGLNLLAMVPGLLTAPRRVWAAFRRGLHSTNLYGPEVVVDMELTVEQLRTQLSLQDAVSPEPAPGEVAKFTGVAAGSVVASLFATMLFPILSLVGWTAYGLSTWRAEHPTG